MEDILEPLGRDQTPDWSRLTNQCMTSAALTLLYYDYALTFDLEHRLFWSWRSFKEWGSILFFLNRYCAAIGYSPLVVQRLALQMSPLIPCEHVHSYREVLEFVMQSIIGLTFITRTYALYERSRVVLIGLTSLALAAIAVGAYLLSQTEKFTGSAESIEPVPGCLVLLASHQSWRVAVIWGCVLVFDFVVVILTLVKTLQLKRRSGENHTLVHVLMRDGVVYFGVITLAMMSTIITISFQSMRGVSITLTNILASILVSRLMFNVREPLECPEMTITTTSTCSTETSTVLSLALTSVEVAEEDIIHESLDHQEETGEETVSAEELGKGEAHLGPWRVLYT